MGNEFYEKGKRQFNIGKPPVFAGPLMVIGRHTLLIYVLHQPFLIALLFAFGLL
jgi:uncharacterized membrane protein